MTPTGPASETRRRLLCWCAGLVALPLFPTGSAVAATLQGYRFRVLRGGSPIGVHSTLLRREGDAVVATTRLELAVYLGPIRVFRYRHEAEEVWRRDRLVSMAATTDDDGKRYQVRARARSDAIGVTGPLGETAAPLHAFTSNTTWNPSFVRQRDLIDCEKGRYVQMRVRDLGPEAVGAAGPAAQARRYSVALPYAEGQIWYDRNGRWIRSVFRTGGEILTYEPDA